MPSSPCFCRGQGQYCRVEHRERVVKIPPSLAEWRRSVWRPRITAFAAAFLAFEGELMAGKKLLPDFGGAAYVWCSVVLFFQLTLVAAYYGSRWLGLRPGRQRLILLLALSGFLSLTRAVLAGWLPLPLQPLLALLPFAGLSVALFCVTPLLHQRQVKQADYSIYAWSNAGALAGLICYPVWVEPRLDLSAQNWIWVIGGILVCGLGLGNGRVFDEEDRGFGLGRTRWQWWVLPGVSSAILLATTNLISFEAAAGPLAWVFPLAVYLGTCIWAFSGDRRASVGLIATAGLMALTAMHLLTEARNPTMVGYALLAGGASMLGCHVWLASSRTENTHGFYAAMALGGAGGSALMVLVVPHVTKGPVEFPILTLATLSITGFMWSGRVVRPLLTTCAVIAIGGTIAAEASGRAAEVARARTLFGCWRVTKEPGQPIYKLINNSTLHGEQDRSHPEKIIKYYATNTALGLLIRQKQKSPGELNLAVVGLGSGALTYYLRPQDRVTFYELDPEAERLARAWFTYLDNPRSRVVLGDGRKSLERESQQYDILILDAFNGDAIPMHLLTREAGEIYRRRLKPGGALAIHITNAHVDLLPVARALAAEMSLGCENQALEKVNWAILSPDGPAPEGPSAQWTDQRSSLLELLKSRPN